MNKLFLVPVNLLGGGSGPVLLGDMFLELVPFILCRLPTYISNLVKSNVCVGVTSWV